MGIRSIVVSHKSLTGLVELARVPGRRIADAFNARTARSYDTVVCTTSWAAEEFRRIGAPNLVEVPLGVDLMTFHPDQREERIRDRYAGRDEVLLVHCSRLSTEKRSDLAVAALAELRAGGVPAVLVVIGDGPRRSALERRSADLPVFFTGFLPHRESVAKLLASADIAVGPRPVETFGLAALEALACGTPAVVNAASALPQVVGKAGAAAVGTGPALPRHSEHPDGVTVSGYDVSRKASSAAPGGTESAVIRLAAFGDSTTAGFGDPMANGRWRGWAALLAESLGPRVVFSNFARSGALTADVAYEQLNAAMLATGAGVVGRDRVVGRPSDQIGCCAGRGARRIC
jgi:Glycosyl transferases group 1/GDSL-like Lipase/Acylhydrolase family